MLYYGMVFITPLVLAASWWLGGAWVWLPLAVLFVAIPALDTVLPLEVKNREAAPDGAGARAREVILRALPMVWVPVQTGITLAVLRSVALDPWSAAEVAGLVLGMGVGGGMLIGVAHELMHRDTWLERRLADIGMMSVSYPHFSIEHVYGHHRNVATRDDPATARFGENLYTFLARAIHGSLIDAWQIEARRLARQGRAVMSVQNRMLQYAAGWLLLIGAIGGWLGIAGIGAFLAQSAVAILLLETVNYVEHYGLVREQDGSGRPVRVAPHHSWNSSHPIANAMILNLARHSDHHAHPARRYPDLRHFDAVPQLPGSYPAMMLLAMLPPLWFRVMDARVAGLNSGPVAHRAG